MLRPSPLLAAKVPRSYHALLAGFVGSCVWLALRHPDAYAAIMQEDRPVEWATVFLFAAAGALTLARAVRRRRPFDALVGLFCLFVAAEEMSWGQRVFGVTPPMYFLENNRQQELNVHNLAGLFDRPKWPLMFVLLGYAGALPLIATTERGHQLLSRIGATPPPAGTIPWFGAAIILLYWYPLTFTGEWVELLAASAFFVRNGMSNGAVLLSSLGVSVAAVAATDWSARASAPRHVDCATAEARALAHGLARGGATPDILEMRSLHKRAWTLGQEGYVDVGVMERSLRDVRCIDERRGEARRRFAVDPWGTAYWVRVQRDSEGLLVTVYSFGPNRRRDEPAQPGDDVMARARLSVR